MFVAQRGPNIFNFLCNPVLHKDKEISLIPSLNLMAKENFFQITPLHFPQCCRVAFWQILVQMSCEYFFFNKHKAATCESARQELLCDSVYHQAMEPCSSFRVFIYLLVAACILCLERFLVYSP